MCGCGYRALELQDKGTSPSHLAPLLTQQARLAAAVAAYAAAAGSSIALTLGAGSSIIPAGLQAAPADAVTATVEAAQIGKPAASGANVPEPSPAMLSGVIQRRSSAVASVH